MYYTSGQENSPRQFIQAYVRYISCKSVQFMYGSNLHIDKYTMPASIFYTLYMFNIFELHALESDQETIWSQYRTCIATLEFTLQMWLQQDEN